MLIRVLMKLSEEKEVGGIGAFDRRRRIVSDADLPFSSSIKCKWSSSR